MTKPKEHYDLVVVGGGVNGTGIAADASGRGLNVLLCEKNDLASATSSSSSKLIHGGLRYLELYEFGLVKQALAEREVLIENAPHIIKPLRFILPHQPHLRPAWLIKSGLFLYDHLAKRNTLEGSHAITFTQDSPLVPEIKQGFEYSDGWVDDARLVVLNAKVAEQHGADIHTYTKCISLSRAEHDWQVILEDDQKKHRTVRAKAIVNAAGPWVSLLFEQIEHIQAPQKTRLIKGSHIIVPKIYDHAKAYILQKQDGRIIFILPFEDEFSLIGTTDIEFNDAPEKAEIDEQEIEYLLSETNRYFIKQTSPQDIIMCYSGVRPLMDDESVDAQKVTRDYTIEVDAIANKLPLVSVFGGKITTYRKLSESVVDKLQPTFPMMKAKWTKKFANSRGRF